MYQIGTVVFLVIFYASVNVIVNAEDTTDAVPEALDAVDSFDTDDYDPQLYNPDSFKSAYEKLYRMSGPPLMLPSVQQKSWQQTDDADANANSNGNDEETTNLSDIGLDTSDVPTTIQPQLDQQTTIKFLTENSGIRSESVKSTQRSISLAAYEQAVSNAELLIGKSSLVGEPNRDHKNEDDLINDTGNVVAAQQQASVSFMPNELNIHNESTDYVMDEANNSQPITSIPYSMDTTITSQPSSSVSFISTRPPNKFEAQPRVYKYNAHEIVRKNFEDTLIRAPLAVLINTAPEPLRKAKLLWTSVLRPNTSIDIVLVAFNSSGVGVTYSFKNSRTMIAGLESVQESREEFAGGSGFYGILRASELVPYDSAIFISTDKIPQDVVLMRNAATTLLKKRVRLYLIWFGAQDIDDNETSTGGALGEVALRTGGEIFRITEESLGNGDIGLVTHHLENDIQGAQVLDIPVNDTDTNLHIKIQGDVDQVTLTTPIGGNVINLLSVDSIERFSDGSFAIYVSADEASHPEYVINLRVSDAPKGVYTLTTIPKRLAGGFYSKYNLLVNTEFNQHHRIAKKNFDKLFLDEVTRTRRSQELSEANSDDEVVWPEDNRLDEDAFTITNDTDVFARSGKNTLQTVTKIDLGAQSQLLASPGATIQIYYEVTNLRDIPSLHNFQVTDEQRFLRTMNPLSMWLAPGQTQNAVVTCYIPPNIEIGTKDKITFTSQGSNMASQSAIITVTSPQTAGLDRRAPLIYWNYGSRCWGRSDAGRCAGSIWSLEITTIDPDTGILRVQSSPKGLLIRDRYTAGTTQEVKATYTASCCTPRVSITSYDLAGNQKTITLDVTEYYLEPVEIIAITLGVILLIFIIIAIIVLIVYCCKKHRETGELPVYRSRSERDRAT